jgi:hypothetical protein
MLARNLYQLSLINEDTKEVTSLLPSVSVNLFELAAECCFTTGSIFSSAVRSVACALVGLHRGDGTGSLLYFSVAK